MDPAAGCRWVYCAVFSTVDSSIPSSPLANEKNRSLFNYTNKLFDSSNHYCTVLLIVGEAPSDIGAELSTVMQEEIRYKDITRGQGRRSPSTSRAATYSLKMKYC